MKIGQGFDVHPLVSGRRLVIGGVAIPFEKQDPTDIFARP